MKEHNVHVRDDDGTTSEQLDSLLDEAETVNADTRDGGAEVRLYVSVDAATLSELEQRAAAEGIDLNAVAAAALRTGARARDSVATLRRTDESFGHQCPNPR